MSAGVVPVGATSSREPCAAGRPVVGGGVAAVVLTVALGCGGASPATRPPPGDAADARTGRRPPRDPGSDVAGGRGGGWSQAELDELWGPARSVYTTDDAPPTLGRFGAGDLDEVLSDATDEDDVVLVPDRRLAQLADAVGRWVVRQDRTPPHGLVEALTRRLGLVEPAPHLLVVGGPSGSAELAERVEAGLADLLPRQPYNRVGGAVIRDGPRDVVVVCLSSRWLELGRRIPRVAAPGDAVAIDARLLGPFRRPVLVVQRPNGDVERRPGTSTRHLAERLPLDDRGVVRVEILGIGPRGDTVLANFPVSVGTDPDDLLRNAMASPAEEDVAAGPEMVARRLEELIAETRAASGVPPLEDHPELDEIAMRHGLDMVANRFVGHTSPTTGTAADRVRQAGLQAELVLENIGRGYGAREIHRGLLDSPGHRANLLDPAVTHVGVGVVQEREGSRNAFVATQLFVRLATPIDVGTAPRRLQRRIGQLRSAEALRPLRRDRVLDEAAADAAQGFFASPDKSEAWLLDRAARRVERRYARIAGVLSVVVRLEDAADVETLLDRRADAIGIGVARGDREGTDPRAAAVVFLLAWDDD